MDRQAAARDRIAAQVLARAQRLWQGFDGYYDDQAVAEVAGRIAEAVRAGQLATAGVTDAYLARVIATMVGERVGPVGVALDPDLRGVPLAEVHARPAEEYRYLISTGVPAETARGRAILRALLIADTDLTMGMREASRQIMDARHIDEYRRVIRPERSRSGSCGLCAAASDRTYSRGDLMPVHDRCHCETLPIVGTYDPGRSLNADELDALYEAAGSTGAADLKKVRVSVHRHGEVGPVLRERGQSFRSPADVAAA